LPTHDRLAGAAGDEKIDETRTRNLDPVDTAGGSDPVDDQLREVARRHA
jgi:hypothetical protein